MLAANQCSAPGQARPQSLRNRLRVVGVMGRGGGPGAAVADPSIADCSWQLSGPDAGTQGVAVVARLTIPSEGPSVLPASGTANHVARGASKRPCQYRRPIIFDNNHGRGNRAGFVISGHHGPLIWKNFNAGSTRFYHHINICNGAHWELRCWCVTVYIITNIRFLYSLVSHGIAREFFKHSIPRSFD